MEVYCTRPGCPKPVNHFPDLDSSATLKTVQQKYCTTCGMPLILVGRYVPLHLLGRGGFGAAFLARDRYTPAMRQCVVKQFQPSGDLNPTQLQIAQGLFEREGAVLEELGNTHPQIPDLLAFFELDVPGHSPTKPNKFFYLVQEFIDGQNLEEEMAQRGAFSETEVREVLTEILKVLQYVHEHQSIHRDIKPSNIMRRRDGRLFLLDFGAVKQVTATGAAGGAGGKASTGIYSMGFAPPEQMAGNVVYPATDLYALGVTCITLLTGKQPNELYDSYSNSWNWKSFAAVSDRLEIVLNRMLLPSPNQRFQSAMEALEALNVPAVIAPIVLPPPPVQRPPVAPVAPPATAVQTPIPPPPVQMPIPFPPSVSVTPPIKPAISRRRFSLLELIGNAAFTGFEGGLLGIALLSFLGTTLLGAGFWVGLVGLLILAQSFRWIERLDLIIITVLTLVILWFLPQVKALPLLQLLGSPIITLLVLAGFLGLFAVIIALIFRLVYSLVSRLF